MKLEKKKNELETKILKKIGKATEKKRREHEGEKDKKSICTRRRRNEKGK